MFIMPYFWEKNLILDLLEINYYCMCVIFFLLKAVIERAADKIIQSETKSLFQKYFYNSVPAKHHWCDSGP